MMTTKQYGTFPDNSQNQPLIDITSNGQTALVEQQKQAVIFCGSTKEFFKNSYQHVKNAGLFIIRVSPGVFIVLARAGSGAFNGFRFAEYVLHDPQNGAKSILGISLASINALGAAGMNSITRFYNLYYRKEEKYLNAATWYYPGVKTDRGIIEKWESVFFNLNVLNYCFGSGASGILSFSSTMQLIQMIPFFRFDVSCDQKHSHYGVIAANLAGAAGQISANVLSFILYSWRNRIPSYRIKLFIEFRPFTLEAENYQEKRGYIKLINSVFCRKNEYSIKVYRHYTQTTQLFSKDGIPLVSYQGEKLCFYDTHLFCVPTDFDVKIKKNNSLFIINKGNEIELTRKGRTLLPKDKSKRKNPLLIFPMYSGKFYIIQKGIITPYEGDYFGQNNTRLYLRKGWQEISLFDYLSTAISIGLGTIGVLFSNKHLVHTIRDTIVCHLYRLWDEKPGELSDKVVLWIGIPGAFSNIIVCFYMALGAIYNAQEKTRKEREEKQHAIAAIPIEISIIRENNNEEKVYPLEEKKKSFNPISEFVRGAFIFIPLFLFIDSALNMGLGAFTATANLPDTLNSRKDLLYDWWMIVFGILGGLFISYNQYHLQAEGTRVEAKRRKDAREKKAQPPSAAPTPLLNGNRTRHEREEQNNGSDEKEASVPLLTQPLKTSGFWCRVFSCCRKEKIAEEEDYIINNSPNSVVGIGNGINS